MPSGTADDEYVREVLAVPGVAELGAREVLARVAVSLAEDPGAAAQVADILGSETYGGLVGLPSRPAEVASAPLLGLIHQALQSRDARRAAGVYYTPPEIVDGVLGLSWPTTAPMTVCDLSVGGGAFLLGAADRLRHGGVDPVEILRERLWGSDVDPLAVAVARSALLLWSLEVAGEPIECPNIVTGDPLDQLSDLFPTLPRGFELVVGNPPFLGQLRQSTARTNQDLMRLRGVLGSAVGPYTDSAVLFLLAAERLTVPGGRVAMLVPESVLTARDAATARGELLDRADLEAIWVADEAVFDAAVRVCAPVLVRREPDSEPVHRRAVRVSIGRRFLDRPQIDGSGLNRAPTWGLLLAGARGVPMPDLDTASCLGEWCGATAGFRDQYYGVAPYVTEEADLVRGADAEAGIDESTWPRLVTSGLVDPAACLWGRRNCRFAKQKWLRPRIDLAALALADPVLHRWVRARLAPKLVVATQTRVLEVAADEMGTWFPSTPTISVAPDGDRLWQVAATLSAPAVSAWAMVRYGGSALSGDAVKLAASQILEIPLPVDRDALTEGAALFRQASNAVDDTQRAGTLEAFAAAMQAAYSVSSNITEWWLGRLPGAAPRQPAASSSH